jgi:hypothetical protein
VAYHHSLTATTSTSAAAAAAATLPQHNEEEDIKTSTVTVLTLRCLGEDNPTENTMGELEQSKQPAGNNDIIRDSRVDTNTSAENTSPKSGIVPDTLAPVWDVFGTSLCRKGCSNVLSLLSMANKPTWKSGAGHRFPSKVAEMMTSPMDLMETIALSKQVGSQLWRV